MALSTNTNIYPAGPTVSISATTTSSQAYVTTASDPATGNNISAILVENLDATNDVFVNWSTNPTVTATVPSGFNGPQAGITIQNGQGKIINLGQQGTFINNVTIAANAVTSTATVHITPVF